MLPHQYPFRFLEPPGPGVQARIAVTGGAWASRGRDLPLTLVVEILAQSCLAILGGDGDPGRAAFLAGVDDVRLWRPLRPGDIVTARAELTGRFGPLVKARVELSSDSGPCAAGDLLLALR